MRTWRLALAGVVVLASVLGIGGVLAAQEVALSSQANTDILPGVELTVEEVEPGVYRVLSDGMRDLSSVQGGLESQGIRAGDDGTIWLVRPKWFARLGDEERHALPAWSIRDIAIASDGTVWAVRGSGELWSRDGEQWKRRSPGRRVDVAAVEVGPDDTVWASWTKTAKKGKTIVGTVGPDGLERVAAARGEPSFEGFVVTNDGDPLLRFDWAYRGIGPMRASHYADGSWHHMGEEGVGMTALGRDGSVWMLVAREHPYLDDSGREYERAIPLDALVRFGGTERQTWGADDGMQALASHYRVSGDMQVGPDGSLWVSYPVLSPDALGGPVAGIDDDIDGDDSDAVREFLARLYSEFDYDGVARFDGTSWQRYLRGHIVHIMAIAPDGSVWVSAGKPSRGIGPQTEMSNLYVITPVAVAGTE